MDQAGPSTSAPAGVSIRNGPVLESKMDIDEPATNGKRKARSSISKPVYKDEEDSEDDAPLVCLTTSPLPNPNFSTSKLISHTNYTH